MSSMIDQEIARQGALDSAAVGALYTSFWTTRDPRVLLSAASMPRLSADLAEALVELAAGPLVADPLITAYVLALTAEHARSSNIDAIWSSARGHVLARFQEDPGLADIVTVTLAQEADRPAHVAETRALRAVASAALEPARAYLREMADPFAVRTSTHDRVRRPVPVGFDASPGE